MQGSGSHPKVGVTVVGHRLGGQRGKGTGGGVGSLIYCYVFYIGSNPSNHEHNLNRPLVGPS